jgi:hypothetical protein
VIDDRKPARALARREVVVRFECERRRLRLLERARESGARAVPIGGIAPVHASSHIALAMLIEDVSRRTAALPRAHGAKSWARCEDEVGIATRASHFAVT